MDILGKKVFVDYIYFKCNTPISASNISFGEKTVIEIELSEESEKYIKNIMKERKIKNWN